MDVCPSTQMRRRRRYGTWSLGTTRRKPRSQRNLTPITFSASVRQILYASWILVFHQVMKTDYTVDEPAAGHSEQNGRDQKLHRLTFNESLTQVVASAN